jgi:hypothetical protein
MKHLPMIDHAEMPLANDDVLVNMPPWQGKAFARIRAHERLLVLDETGKIPAFGWVFHPALSG